MSLAARVCACCCGTKERYTLASATSPSIMRRAREDEFTLDDAFELESDLEDDEPGACMPHQHPGCTCPSTLLPAARADFLVRRGMSNGESPDHVRMRRPDRR